MKDPPALACQQSYGWECTEKPGTKHQEFLLGGVFSFSLTVRDVMVHLFVQKIHSTACWYGTLFAIILFIKGKVHNCRLSLPVILTKFDCT